MEPTKKIKKFTSFTQKKGPTIFNIDIPQEPSLIYRYLMELPLGDRIFLSWVNCEIPSVTMDHTMRGEFRHGRGDWQPIRIIFRDLCFGYEEEDWDEFRTRLMYWARNNNKINTTIKRMTPIGETMNNWHLIGCLPSAYHTIYDDTNIDSTEITLHYDHCNTIFNDL